MNKIILIGSGGSGKSTLARKLGELLELEVFHLDALFWQPGWVETPKDEWIKIQQDLIQKEKWIIDGNYSGTMDYRMQAADIIIFLDYSRMLCMWRVLKRRIRYAKRCRPDMAPGCKEHLDFKFMKWVWQFRKKRRPSILEKLSSLQGKNIFIFRNPQQTKKWMNKIKSNIKS